MVIPDKPLIEISRPPILVILVGFVHAVLSPLIILACTWNCIYWGSDLFRMHVALNQVPVLPWVWRHLLTSAFGLPLSIVACASGLWLLHGNPRGRRWTIMLACAATPLFSGRIIHILLYPQQLVPQLATGPLTACTKDLGVMAYWVFVLLLMHLPSVRRFYAPPQPTAESEEITA